MGTDVVLVEGVRTAIGRFGGALSPLSASDLGAAVIREVLRRTNLEPSQVDEVIMGCVGQVAEDAYIARTSAIKAGLPKEVPAYAVNRLCSSGLQSIVSAGQAIRLGEAEVVVAGGVESMSNFPYFLRQARFGYRMGHGTLEDGLIVTLSDPFRRYHMGITAENVAERWGIDRATQDQVALRSQRRMAAAMAAGLFRDQIVPVTVPDRKGERVVDTDEHPRPDTTLEQLAALKPAFKEGGTVTAGNSSGINDGAAAVLVMSSDKARALGLRPRLVLRAAAAAGVEPEYMGIGPVPAVRKALARAGLSLDDIDLIELNEAFAAQAEAVVRDLGLDWERVNVNGGAIAHGHPVGATGAILTVKLMYEMERRGARYGLVTMCIGGGQGLAAVFENPDA
ncbi:MAG: thiolase family protein [Bacillota bacterium]|nr:acetyl-CoA C-acyltransferase [Bacillota bacterium]REJ36128.1 MAG: acetyl-CoA C-acyltransferase [Bacillota bacterium]